MIETILYKLVIGYILHWYSDFHTQGNTISSKKCDTPFMMFLHVSFNTAVMSIYLYHYWNTPIILSLLVIGYSHYKIDKLAKCQGKLNYWQDLSAHLVIIIILILVRYI